MERMPGQRRVLAAFLSCGLAGLGAFACSADAPGCHVNADCASGRCLPSGECASAQPIDAADAGDGVDGGENPFAGPDAGSDAGAPDGSAPLTCAPDKDGTITRAEVPVRAGLHATFRIASNASWSTAGTQKQDGSRVWDLSGALANDQSALVETTPVENTWYASYFVGATYASRLTQAQDLLGVFEGTSDALTLRGVVSPTDGLYVTRLTYDPAVPILKFPLTLGKTWSQTSSVSGFANGVYSSYSEKYDYNVDAKGELKTPFGTFDVLRVQVVLARTVGWYTTTVRTYAFVSECFGTVATATSKDDESSVEFATSAEIRRLAP